MNLSNINLNLIKALDALLTEQNVSKAGARIGITQSAMSIALKQLREIYQDELLIRGQQGRMMLTSLAVSLIPTVKQTIRNIEGTFTSHLPFDPMVSQRAFHIGMFDYIALLLLPRIMQEVAHQAPNVKIVHHSISHLDSLKPFEESGMDVVIGGFDDAPENLKTLSLFMDKAVVVADSKHPAFKSRRLTLKEYAKYPQIFISFTPTQPEQNGLIQVIEKQGCKLSISLMTPHTLIALQALPGTLLMANVVERLATPFLQPLDIAAYTAPYDAPKYHARLYWHPRDQNDSGNCWLRELIKSIAEKI